MPRFLHLADIHLGYDKQGHPERTKDFYRAFADVLERYAIAPEVDFVLIAGDLFEHRQILPATLNQAQLCLDLLREAGIPVLAIEGNHDHRPYGTRTSWLRYLASWDRLILLEPTDEEALDPWSPEEKAGGYMDLDCGVRVIGSRWYGAAAPQAIAKLAAAIRQLPPGPEYTVMMFHHGLEGQIARYTGALRYQDLLPLKAAGVDYLALGHIHKNYTIAEWIFNPGSLEANSVAEARSQVQRGVYLVELSQTGIQAQLQQNYTQRSILRLTLEVNPQHTPEDLQAAAIALIQKQFAANQTQGAIVELRIHGQVAFDRLDLKVRELRQHLQDLSQALIFLLKYEVQSTAYDTAIPIGDRPPSRQEIEQSVFTDLLTANVAYREQAAHLAQGLIDLKTQVLEGRSPADLYSFAQSLLALNSAQI